MASPFSSSHQLTKDFLTKLCIKHLTVVCYNNKKKVTTTKSLKRNQNNFCIGGVVDCHKCTKKSGVLSDILTITAKSTPKQLFLDIKWPNLEKRSRSLSLMIICHYVISLQNNKMRHVALLVLEKIVAVPKKMTFVA